MSIASEITRINNNIANAYDECETKGATMPQYENSANLADTIASIPSGGGDLSEYFDTTITTNTNDTNNLATRLVKKIPSVTLGNNVNSLRGFLSNWPCATLQVPDIDFTNVTMLYRGFYGAKCSSIDLSNIKNATKVFELGSLFSNCSSLETIIGLNVFSNSPISSMESMFSGTKITSMDLSSFQTTSLTTLNSCFSSCSNLINVTLGNLDTSKVTTFYGMFQNCSKIKNIDMSKSSNLSATNVMYMFFATYKLAVLDISSFDFSTPPSNIASMFSYCGRDCLQSDGAYANGIPYIYVKDATAQNWVLTANNGHPNTWTTDNVVIKSN